jgi:hypothetical protein
MTNLTDDEIQYLSTTSTRCFLHEQPARFENLDDDPIPLDRGKLDWCQTAADALMLIGHYRANGVRAHLVFDLAQSEEALEKLESLKNETIVHNLRSVWLYDNNYVVHSEIDFDSSPWFLFSNDVVEKFGENAGNDVMFKGKYFAFINKKIGLDAVENPTLEILTDLMNSCRDFIEETVDFPAPYLITKIAVGKAGKNPDGSKHMTPLNLTMIEIDE